MVFEPSVGAHRSLAVGVGFAALAVAAVALILGISNSASTGGGGTGGNAIPVDTERASATAPATSPATTPTTGSSAITPSTTPTSASPTTTAVDPHRTWLSGSDGSAQGGVSVGQFATWRGTKSTVVTDFLGSGTWTSMTDVSWAIPRYSNTSYHVVWSVPMLPIPASGGRTKIKPGDPTIEQGATGAYNETFKTLAKHLVAAGASDVTLRIGWEMNGNWYQWSGLNDPAAYVAYWRQIVTSMRSVPGQHFTFDWSVANGAPDPTKMYPGDAYVDYIGDDVYDQSWASNYQASNHVEVWKSLTTGLTGLNWVSQFADVHGKPMSLPEWGLAYRCDGHGGGDDPYFIKSMHTFIQTHNVGYETYFRRDDSNCQRHDITASGVFPKAAAEYQSLWQAQS